MSEGGVPIRRVQVPSGTRVASGTTNAYVVGDRRVVIVDPAGRSERLERLVDDRTVEAIVVTHAHSDHVGMVDEYASRFDAPTVALEGWRDRFARRVGRPPDRTVPDGGSLSLSDGVDLLAVATPGHAPDHVLWVVGDEAISGDLVMAEGSVYVGGEDGDMAAYFESLRKLVDLGATRLHPGHGPAVDDPDRTVAGLLEHRLDREREIREAVEDGLTAVPAIVDAIYERDIEHVRDLAEATVIAHLEKLHADGAVSWDGDRATPARVVDGD